MMMMLMMKEEIFSPFLRTFFMKLERKMMTVENFCSFIHWIHSTLIENNDQLLSLKIMIVIYCHDLFITLSSSVGYMFSLYLCEYSSGKICKFFTEFTIKSVSMFTTNILLTITFIVHRKPQTVVPNDP